MFLVPPSAWEKLQWLTRCCFMQGFTLKCLKCDYCLQIVRNFTRRQDLIAEDSLTHTISVHLPVMVVVSIQILPHFIILDIAVFIELHVVLNVQMSDRLDFCLSQELPPLLITFRLSSFVSFLSIRTNEFQHCGNYSKVCYQITSLRGYRLFAADEAQSILILRQFLTRICSTSIRTLFRFSLLPTVCKQLRSKWGNHRRLLFGGRLNLRLLCACWLIQLTYKLLFRICKKTQ